MNFRWGGRKPAGDLDDLADLRAELRRVLEATVELAERAEIHPDRGIDMREAVARYERGLIRAALHMTRGQQNRAAELLHMKPSTLCTKIKALGIDPGEFLVHTK